VTTDTRAAIRAAWQGRVLDLLVAENAEIWGVWNDEIQNFTTDDQQEELLNAAAVQTLRHRGRAFVLNPPDMPVPGSVAAVLRF
jgi:hypothetical protein